MSERQEDEPIFGEDDVDPWLEALDSVLHEKGRVRARGTTPHPGGFNVRRSHARDTRPRAVAGVADSPAGVAAAADRSRSAGAAHRGEWPGHADADAVVRARRARAARSSSARAASRRRTSARSAGSSRRRDFRRPIVDQDPPEGRVGEEDHMRFQMEKELLERVQGHPNIIELLRLGRGRRPRRSSRRASATRCENDFMILELLDMSLEERLKGSRNRGRRDDLLALRHARAAVPRARVHDPGRERRSSTRTSSATSATATSSRRTC